MVGFIPKMRKYPSLSNPEAATIAPGPLSFHRAGHVGRVNFQSLNFFRLPPKLILCTQQFSPI